MSGGSYDYLCFKDAEMIEAEPRYLEELCRMRDRLNEIRAYDAARATEAVRLRVVYHLRDREEERRSIDVAIKEVRDVWHAVEWADSCDWGMDEVLRALHTYRGSPPCDHPERSEWRPVSWLDRASGEWRHGRRRYCLRCGQEERGGEGGTR